MQKILIGADPELFVWDKKKNLLVSGDGMVAGTKEEPTPVEFGAVQVDGMALEFNIEPATTRDEFFRNISLVKDQLHKMIGAEDYDLLINPTARFTEEVWWGCSPNAKILGCTPDINAWTNSYNKIKKPKGFFRTASGHIHIGYTDGASPRNPLHVEDCSALVRQLDASLGIQSVLWDDDKERRTLYGSAGAFRPKPYGAEYRVLSNVWLKTEQLTKHVYDVAYKATEDFFKGIDYVEDLGRGTICSIIDSSDVARASELSKHLSNKFSIPMLDNN